MSELEENVSTDRIPRFTNESAGLSQHVYGVLPSTRLMPCDSHHRIQPANWLEKKNEKLLCFEPSPPIQQIVQQKTTNIYPKLIQNLFKWMFSCLLWTLGPVQKDTTHNFHEVGSNKSVKPFYKGSKSRFWKMSKNDIFFGNSFGRIDSNILS